MARASKTLLNLKLKRTAGLRAMAYGGGLMNEIVTYGSSGGGGRSLPSGSYTTNQNPSGAYNPSYRAGTGTAGGGGGGSSGYGGGPVSTPKTEEEPVVEEVIVEAEPILISEGGFDENGVYSAPVYELPTGAGTAGYGTTGSSTDTTEAESDALAEKTQRDLDREITANNEISPEDNVDVQEVVDTMANTGDNAVHPRYQNGGSGYGGDTVIGGGGGTGGNQVEQVGTGAPIDLTQVNPTYSTPEMKAAKISGYGASTAKNDIQSVGYAGTVAVKDITAPEMAGYATQDAITKVKGPDTKAGDGAEYTADQVGYGAKAKAAKASLGPGAVIKGAVEGEASEVETAERNRYEEERAKGKAAERPDEKDYAVGETTDERFRVEDVEGPEVTVSEGETISDAKIAELTALAKERGVNPEDAIADFKKSQAFRKVQSGKAAEGTYKPRLGEAPSDTAARAEYFGVDYTPEGGNTEIDDVPAYKKAATREAQVGQAAERIASELGDAPSLDLEGRNAITGTEPVGTAAQIGGIPTMAAAQMQAVQGQQRVVAAQDMMAVIADVPEEVTAAISKDPAKVKAELDEDADPQVTAAIAALPQEALVSTQMEGLLAGMEDGETPLWARPAVAAMEAQMAKRGLSASSVGRDALFNAIIQSAMPIAQSNAQALQARAQQNLGNEQQANLASAQNTMQVRMANLSNRQTAASQTAQMAQEIKVQEGVFAQQAVMTTAQQAQQTKLTNAEMAQQRAQQESSQRQQAAISQLNATAQMDLANLQAESNRAGKQMDADQQAKLQSYNAQVNKIMRTADLKQDMEKANLSGSLQIEMQSISEQNAAAKDTMTAEQTERLTSLQTLVDFRKTDASFAQQMDMANMTNEQQMELAMLQEKAASDSANFTADNQFEMQRLNNIVARSTRQAELNSRMEEVNLDAELKVQLSELSEKNITARADMSAEQQMKLANLNTLVDFRKTNAGFAQQMDIANLGNEQQMELANLQERSATDTANFTETNRARTQELNTFVQVMSQNEQLKQNADMAQLSMQEKINLANLSSRSQADMASMSAENIAELQVYEKKMAAGQVNAQLAQQMGLANLSNEQSAAMFNAQINANFDMSQMSNEQQMAVANSKFMQTMTATKFNADQQSAIQNATMLTQVDMSNADAATRVRVENAKSFLAMDMANLSNEQQANVLTAQNQQQVFLSDQASKNASRQFGAANQQQADQFMASIGVQIEQYNSSAQSARNQFNATEKNRMAALEAGNELQAAQFNNQLSADVQKFNEQQDYQRDQWNASNAQAVEQSNVQWRRQANVADTAAQNSANQQNAQISYNLTSQEQTQLWQQLRDEAAYVRQNYENEMQRKAQMIATAIGNEKVFNSRNDASSFIDTLERALSSTG